MGDFPELRREIAHVAGRQWGHVTRGQLLGRGIAPGTISAWVSAGKLIPVHAGVYAVGYRRVEPVARALAAVLACGPGAVLSHDSALALWDLRRWPPVPELIAADHVRRPGIRAHRSRTLTDEQCTVQLAVPVTRAARAIHDMRRRLTVRQRIRLVNQARLRHVLTAEEAERLLHHRRNPTRSGLEDAFQRFVGRHDLPQPEINAHPGGHEVDAVYRRQRVIIELDDYATHGDPATFQADRDRDLAHLVDDDLVTIRLTRPRLTAETAERLRALLLRRGASPPPPPDPPGCSR